MMEKVKLTREQADAVRSALAKYTFEESMENHLAGWNAPTRRCLNGIKTEDMARALLIGYEVEESFGVGDWVVVSWKDTGEKIYQVRESESATLVKVSGCLFAPLDIVRHATPEEIKAEKERRVWAEIGREVGEFRIGDAFVHNSFTFRVFNAEEATSLKESYVKNGIKGFYPAESFIKFGGADE